MLKEIFTSVIKDRIIKPFLIKYIIERKPSEKPKVILTPRISQEDVKKMSL